MSNTEAYLAFMAVFFLIMWIMAILRESTQSRLIGNLQQELKHRDRMDDMRRKTGIDPRDVEPPK